MAARSTATFGSASTVLFSRNFEQPLRNCSYRWVRMIEPIFQMLNLRDAVGTPLRIVFSDALCDSLDVRFVQRSVGTKEHERRHSLDAVVTVSRFGLQIEGEEAMIVI